MTRITGALVGRFCVPDHRSVLQPSRIQRVCLGREDKCSDRLGSLGSRLDKLTRLGHMTLSTAIPSEFVEHVAEGFAHVFRGSVHPVQMWCGLLVGAHAPGRKPMSGVVPANPGVKDQMPSTPGRDNAHDDVSDDVPRGRGIKASLITAYWVHNGARRRTAATLTQQFIEVDATVSELNVNLHWPMHTLAARPSKHK